MRSLRLLAITALLLVLSERAARADAPAPKPVKHRVMLMEYEHGHSRLVELDADGKATWSLKLPALSVAFEPLEDGHVLVAAAGMPTGVREVDRDGKVVWQYDAKCAEVLGFERLPDGHVLLAEEGPCQAVEIDRAGKVVSTVPLQTKEQQPHRQVRMIHRLPNGHLLAAHEVDAVVREYDPTGKVVWEYPNVPDCFEALRLPNGHTLIGCGTQGRIIEVTPDKTVAWEFKAADAPQLNLAWITSLQILPNGNYVIANFLRGHEGQGVHAFEVTRDKQIVWSYADHANVKSITMVKVLDDR